MFNVRELGADDEQFVVIGDKGMMKVTAIGSLFLKFMFLREGDDTVHTVETQIDNVLVVPGIGFNLFSGWRASVEGAAVALHRDGTHISNGKLIFMRGRSNDYAYAIRLPPPVQRANISLTSVPPSAPLPFPRMRVLCRVMFRVHSPLPP
ncbi:unnamed protein product [Pylaiella littoralis]